MEADPLKPSSEWPSPAQSATTATGNSPRPRRHPPVWAQRMLLVIEVSISIWAGILVMLLPWTPLWSNNPMLASWPAVKLLLTHSFVRGLISGIGVVDVCMGIADVVRYHDQR